MRSILEHRAGAQMRLLVLAGESERRMGYDKWVGAFDQDPQKFSLSSVLPFFL
jgi:hypothetical protein